MDANFWDDLGGLLDGNVRMIDARGRRKKGRVAWGGRDLYALGRRERASGRRTNQDAGSDVPLLVSQRHALGNQSPNHRSLFSSCLAISLRVQMDSGNPDFLLTLGPKRGRRKDWTDIGISHGTSDDYHIHTRGVEERATSSPD